MTLDETKDTRGFHREHTVSVSLGHQHSWGLTNLSGQYSFLFIPVKLERIWIQASILTGIY